VNLHTGVGLGNADTHEVVVAELTPDGVGDVSTVTELLERIGSGVASLTADGAYDGTAVYDAVAERHPGAAVIIPPRTIAIVNESATSQRDGHIALIAQHGRIGWQRRSVYSRMEPGQDSSLSLQDHHWPTILRSESAQSAAPSQRLDAMRSIE
jgi:hypothetical protein